MGVIYMPEPESKPQRPVVNADTYPLGTRWMSDDNSVWEVEWDNQDKRHMWVLVPNRPIRHEEWCHTVTGCTEPNHCTCES